MHTRDVRARARVSTAVAADAPLFSLDPIPTAATCAHVYPVTPGLTAARLAVNVCQEIFLEEDRHQRVMLAIESSLTGCGSDDWSVDSDYAFQDFVDEDISPTSNHDHNSFPQTPPARHGQSQARVVREGADDVSIIAGLGNRIPDECSGGVADKDSLAGGNPYQVISGESPVRNLQREAAKKLAAEPTSSSSGIGIASEHVSLGCERDAADGSCPSREDTRHLGDPGSSTENVHILHVEQRMFLKVCTL